MTHRKDNDAAHSHYPFPGASEEIELTPEMIEAGENAVYEMGAECASPYSSAADLAIRVFRAMARARLPSHNK